MNGVRRVGGGEWLVASRGLHKGRVPNGSATVSFGHYKYDTANFSVSSI